MDAYNLKGEEVGVEQEYRRGSIVDNQEDRLKVVVSLGPVGENHERERHPVAEPQKEAYRDGDHGAQGDFVHPLKSHFGNQKDCKRGVENEDKYVSPEEGL